MVTQSERIKVAICTPSGDDVKTDFAVSLSSMVMDLPDVPGIEAAIILNQRGSILPESRRRLVQRARAWGATHVLFLDSDMCFPSWLCKRLVECNKDIVGANAAMRGNFYPPVPAGGIQHSDNGKTMHRLYATEGDEPIEADKVGFGALLIRREVFEKIEKPWFAFTYKDLEPTDDLSCGYEGEDLYFCKKAKAAGFNIWLDPVSTRFMGHTGTHIYSFHRDHESDGPLESSKFRSMLRSG